MYDSAIQYIFLIASFVFKLNFSHIDGVYVKLLNKSFQEWNLCNNLELNLFSRRSEFKA